MNWLRKYIFAVLISYCLRVSNGERVSLVLGNCICIVTFVILVKRFVVSMTTVVALQTAMKANQILGA